MLFGECCSQWIISSTKRFHRQKFLHGLCTAPAVKKIGQESRCSQGIQSPQSETSGSQMNFVAESRERLSVASNTFTTTLIFLREGTLSWYTDSRSKGERLSLATLRKILKSMLFEERNITSASGRPERRATGI
ncbi:hypothetical protein SCLCIDRAFT_247813 [Scleroderma citrinum Foug A]|uniref:Uncharacterized protein n=1 Tax=Scleroderma citrinum Foug A TaxID=1036808 RepID=A0A0C3D6A4_9AGAM|nr:hypothetical protein SCLCIDRAFT_247813 [Scleroderma citrinum Foug A]